MISAMQKKSSSQQPKWSLLQNMLRGYKMRKMNWMLWFKMAVGMVEPAIFCINFVMRFDVWSDFILHSNVNIVSIYIVSFLLMIYGMYLQYQIRKADNCHCIEIHSCERLTPFPMSCSWYTLRFLFLWCNMIVLIPQQNIQNIVKG